MGDESVKIGSFWKRVHPKNVEFASKGSKFFPLRMPLGVKEVSKVTSGLQICQVYLALLNIYSYRV